MKIASYDGRRFASESARIDRRGRSPQPAAGTVDFVAHASVADGDRGVGRDPPPDHQPVGWRPCSLSDSSRRRRAKVDALQLPNVVPYLADLGLQVVEARRALPVRSAGRARPAAAASSSWQLIRLGLQVLDGHPTSDEGLPADRLVGPPVWSSAPSGDRGDETLDALVLPLLSLIGRLDPFALRPGARPSVHRRPRSQRRRSRRLLCLLLLLLSVGGASGAPLRPGRAAVVPVL